MESNRTSRSNSPEHPLSITDALDMIGERPTGIEEPKTAEQLARDSLPELFDTLPQAVKDAMIAAQQTVLDQRIALRRLELLEREEAARHAYKERQERGAAISREQMRASGIAERIGRSKTQEPRPPLVRTEQGCIQMSSELPANESQPESLLQGANVLGFRRQTILALIPQMQEIWNAANEHRYNQRTTT